MSAVTPLSSNLSLVAAREPLAARIARAASKVSLNDLPLEVIAKVKLCLIDVIGCAFESSHLPWCRQAVALAERVETGATIIGAPFPATIGDAAFANAVAASALDFTPDFGECADRACADHCVKHELE